ncbi:MAG: phosphatidate cytidylyltransferase [Bacteroidetes bacterium]|nr:phosphatidate cytidylyltransferase [Bacteroidota bacterium]
MSNFWARTITGLSMVFLILATLCFTNIGFAAIFLLVTILGLIEFYTITNNGDCQPQKLTGTILGTIWYLLSAWSTLWPAQGRSYLSVVLLISFFFVPFVMEIFRKKEKPLLNVAVTIMGMIYVAIPLSLLNFMNNPRGGTIFNHFAAYLTVYFLITWIYDTGAYLVGMNFGKHKFFERISPKKTWEGTIGGVVVAAFAATGLYFISDGISLAALLILTGLVILFGTFGDLAESLFKRSLNLKDSGNILPGHGGILDRFDTIFISAPFVFLYFVFLIMI